jgi:hypothetical protein
MQTRTLALAPRRTAVAALAVSAAVLAMACGGATRSASPQGAANAKGGATLTGASVKSAVERVLVADKGTISMVARDGCLATVSAMLDDTGSSDELRIRCPRPERLDAWFKQIDGMTSSVPLTRVADEDEDVQLPAAELVTLSGAVLRMTRPADVERMVSAVRALGAELAAAEVPNPGPTSAAGYQMLRVMGPAHVFFGGEPTEGVLDARMSTSGQYYCEFMANTGEGPLHATKSGWITPTTASRAIDEVLTPFRALGPGTTPRSTFAAAFVNGSETRADVPSTAAVFERFAPIQDALGDACLPELEPPAPLGL